MAECRRVGGKSLRFAGLVTLETVSQDGEILPLEPLPDCLDRIGGDFETGRFFEWQ